VDNSTHGAWNLGSRRDLETGRSRSACAALLEALQQLGMVDREFNILPPPNQPGVADPGKPN